MSHIANLACDWDGPPAYRPLTGLGEGRISGKGFAPRQRHETADATYDAASAIWAILQRGKTQGAAVQAFWTDVCGHKHLIFRDGRDCRLATRGQSVAADYAAALAAAPARVRAIEEGQAQPIEPVRYGRDVVAGEWTDPVQTNKFSKAPERVRGFRRTDALVTLLKRGTITERHVAVGFKLRDDHELSEGARIGGQRSEIRGGGDASGPADVQLAACARFRAAIQAVGKTVSGMVVHIVLNNQTIASWAEMKGMSASVATGYLISGLDRLQDHYEPSMDPRDLERARDVK